MANNSNGKEGADKGKSKGEANPEHVKKARELRDRYLEQVNSDPSMLFPAGKYEVCRQLALPAKQTTQLLIAA